MSAWPRGVLSALVLCLCAACQPDKTTFRELPTPAGGDSGQPHLASAPDGTAVLSWLETNDDVVTLQYARLKGDAWSSPVEVASGADWFVNWADFPSVVPMSERLWAAHWLVRQSAGGYAYDIAIATSADGGQTWDAPFAPHHDGTATEHGFVTLLPRDGRVAAVWLDGRDMAAQDSGHGHESGGAMTLRSAVVDGGQTLDDAVLDDRVCDCCQTDAALTADGAVVVYRNRTDAEVRDIYVGRFENDAWQSGVPVADDGWTVAGCPVNGPAVDAAGTRVVVAWFTAAGGEARVRAAFSNDGGATFAEPLNVGNGRPVGRVDVVLVAGGRAVVSWLERGEGDRADLMLRGVAADGRSGAPLHVLTTDARRPAGFPQMLALDGSLLLAWTDVSGATSRVATALLPVDALSGF